MRSASPASGSCALVCVVLAATGSGAAFAWHGYGGGELSTGALTAAPKAASAPQAAAAQEALLRNLTEAQQRAAAIAQGNQDLLRSQAAEIKRLSEAVAQLSTRVDGMGVRNAQAAVPRPRRRSRRLRRSLRPSRRARAAVAGAGGEAVATGEIDRAVAPSPAANRTGTRRATRPASR